MKIVMTSVPVDDQEKALRFYTDVLGFVKKTDIPLGEARWLTGVSLRTTGTELLLEPDTHPAVRPLKRALVNELAHRCDLLYSGAASRLNFAAA